MHIQRASGLGSRFHVRVRGQHQDPVLGWVATAGVAPRGSRPLSRSRAATLSMRTAPVAAGSTRDETSSRAGSSPAATRLPGCGGGTRRASSSATVTTRPRTAGRSSSRLHQVSRLMRLLLSGIAAVAAVLLLSGAGAPEPGAGSTSASRFTLAHADAFEDYPLYFAGDRVEGFPLVAVLRRADTADFVSFVYGDCTAADDAGVRLRSRSRSGQPAGGTSVCTGDNPSFAGSARSGRPSAGFRRRSSTTAHGSSCRPGRVDRRRLRGVASSRSRKGCRRASFAATRLPREAAALAAPSAPAHATGANSTG